MLVLRPGALGDALLAVPALRALRRAFGEVTFASHGAAADLLRVTGEIDCAMAFDDPSLGWLFSGPVPEGEGVVAWMASRPPGLPPGGLVAPSRPPRMDQHCARYLLDTLAPLGIDLTWDERPLNVTPILGEEVLVHPGSGSLTKNWPAERFAALIRGLERPVCLVVGEADGEAAARVEQCLGYRPPRLSSPPLATLAARLAGAPAYVGNDSGVSHLAGLCGTRTIALFGPTNPTVWRPLGPKVQVLPFETDPAAVAALLTHT